MRQCGLIWTTLLVVIPGCSAAANVGYETVVSQQDGTVVVNSYSDSGALVDSFHTPEGDLGNAFAAPLVTNTVYLDSTSLGNALPARSTIIQENFNNPIDLTVTERLISSFCDPRYGDCSNPPSPFLSIMTSVDGSSISGDVGGCSGAPRCTSDTGWGYYYLVDLHFNKPIVGLTVTNGLMQGVNLSTLYYEISLPTDDLFRYGFGGSTNFNGWVFPDGVSDVYLNYYGLPSNGENGAFGLMPFTLSNLEIALGAPEPSTEFLSITGVFAMIGLIARRRRSP